MDKVTGKLTVFFENPFWVGVFERSEDGMLSACRVVFGAEPKDGQVWEFVLKEYDKLPFSPAVAAASGKESANPKRRQREAQKLARGAGVGTKSQQALQLQREALKTQRKAASREQRLAQQQRLYALKQEKRRQKRRGR